MKRLFSMIAISLVSLALTACSALRSNTAMDLIKHQQEQQAMEHSAELSEARRNQPSQADMLLNLVREARNGQRYFAVVAYARQYIKLHGHTPELDALYAEGLMNTGQEAQSQALYQSLVHTTFAAQAYHGLGLLAARSHQSATAVQALSQAVSLQPANPMYLSDLGYAQMLSGDLDGAGLSLGQAAELAPDDAKALSNMAVLLLLRNQSANANALMHKAHFADSARQRIYALAAQLRSGRTDSTPLSLLHPRLVQ
jgi:Flp pilus assembly protein TadD